MGKLKLIYQSDDGKEEVLEETVVSHDLHSLSSIESEVESFRKKALPKATAKLLDLDQRAYIKKKS